MPAFKIEQNSQTQTSATQKQQKSTKKRINSEKKKKRYEHRKSEDRAHFCSYGALIRADRSSNEMHRCRKRSASIGQVSLFEWWEREREWVRIEEGRERSVCSVCEEYIYWERRVRAGLGHSSKLLKLQKYNIRYLHSWFCYAHSTPQNLVACFFYKI